MSTAGPGRLGEGAATPALTGPLPSGSTGTPTVLPPAGPPAPIGTDVAGQPPPGPPRAPAMLPQPGFGEAVLLLMLMFAASAMALVLMLLGGRGAELDIVLLGIVEILSLTLGLTAGLRISRVSWREAFLPRRFPPWMVLLTLPLTGAMAIVANALDAWICLLVPVPDAIAVEMARLFYAGDATGWLRVTLTAAVLIPVGEELFFRGLLLRGFLLRYGRRTALLLTATLFAIVHFNPWGLLSIFLVGLFLGWLVLRTGSLWCACLAHGVYNLVAVLTLNLSLDGPPTPETLASATPGPLGSPATLTLAAAAVLLGLWLLDRYGRRAEPWAPAPAAPASTGWTAPAPEL